MNVARHLRTDVTRKMTNGCTAPSRESSSSRRALLSMPQALGVWVSPHGHACRHRVNSQFGWVRCLVLLGKMFAEHVRSRHSLKGERRRDGNRLLRRPVARFPRTRSPDVSAASSSPSRPDAASSTFRRFRFGRCFVARKYGRCDVARRRRCLGRLAAPIAPPERTRNASTRTAICREKKKERRRGETCRRRRQLRARRPAAQTFGRPRGSTDPSVTGGLVKRKGKPSPRPPSGLDEKNTLGQKRSHLAAKRASR